MLCFIYSSFIVSLLMVVACVWKSGCMKNVALWKCAGSSMVMWVVQMPKTKKQYIYRNWYKNQTSNKKEQLHTVGWYCSWLIRNCRWSGIYIDLLLLFLLILHLLLLGELVSVLTQRVHGVAPRHLDGQWKRRERIDHLFYAFEQKDAMDNGWSVLMKMQKGVLVQ